MMKISSLNLRGQWRAAALGLALALGVALYITKAPIPFINKVPQRTAEQDNAETQRNRNWDPNAALGGKSGVRATAAASAASAAIAANAAAAAAMPAAPAALPPMPAPTAVKPPPKNPAAILAGETPAATPPQPRSTTTTAEPFIYFVQAGAFTRNEDAEQQRVKLAMIGQGGRITEREQAGRTVYRVRLGPYPARAEADALQVKLQEQGIEAQIVRVEKP